MNAGWLDDSIAFCLFLCFSFAFEGDGSSFSRPEPSLRTRMKMTALADTYPRKQTRKPFQTPKTIPAATCMGMLGRKIVTI